MVKLSILLTLFYGEMGGDNMRIGMVCVMAGVITTIFGIVFHLQGQSVIGPESSFMYSNPAWTGYGLAITAAGIIISSLGVVISKRTGL